MNRIYHTWDKWECYPAGFYEVNVPKGMTEEICHDKYREVMSDLDEFKEIMRRILVEWPHSVEHNLTNERMNRVAWIGQAAMAYQYGIPAKFRGGFHLLPEHVRRAADQAAL